MNPFETLVSHRSGLKNDHLEESPPPPLSPRAHVHAETGERDMHCPHLEGGRRLVEPGERAASQSNKCFLFPDPRFY